MRYGHFLSATGAIIDEVLAVFMPRRHSYTGLDQAEIFCHGGSQVVRVILDEIVTAGARPAEPGEFTRLAFLNGRIDLAKAEAVAELIAASTQASYEAGREHLIGDYSGYVDELRHSLVTILADIETSIDFSDDEVDPIDPGILATALNEVSNKISRLAATYRGGRIIREGYRVAICGRPNAGKSSLFNLLLEQERALIDREPGTTRDYLSEWIDMDGFAVNLIDTAGIRTDAGRVEKQGQTRSQEIIAGADIVLWLADVSLPNWQNNTRDDIGGLDVSSIILIGNKIDLVSNWYIEADSNLLSLSCLTKVGLSDLRKALIEQINEGVRDLTAGQVVTSARHRNCLDRAAKATALTRKSVEAGESPEITAFELRQSVEALAEITGQVYTEEILGEIFSRFCIGK